MYVLPIFDFIVPITLIIAQYVFTRGVRECFGFFLKS